MILSPLLKNFIKEHENDDIHSLALHAKKYPDIDMQMAVQQIAGRKIIKEKVPSWYENDSIIYPRHISLEQCSSEQTASFKSSLVEGNSMVDLTGGFGIDFSFLSSRFNKAAYIEQQEELCRIAASNFQSLNLKNTIIVNSDAIKYLKKMPPVDLIYIDPARRDTNGRKTVRIEDCTPDILEIEELLEEKAGKTMIKLSPMLDISLAVKSMRNISEVHVVSVNNECKELLFIKNEGNTSTIFHCINILKDRIDRFTFSKDQEEQDSICYTSQIGKYLYEPNPSILKAGAYKYFAKANNLEKLHSSSHLYTSDSLLPSFQGREFIVQQVCTLNKKDIKQYLSDMKQANITPRNFPLSTQEIRQKTKIKEGGDIYIFATTLANDQKVLIICKKV